VAACRCSVTKRVAAATTRVCHLIKAWALKWIIEKQAKPCRGYEGVGAISPTEQGGVGVTWPERRLGRRSPRKRPFVYLLFVGVLLERVCVCEGEGGGVPPLWHESPRGGAPWHLPREDVRAEPPRSAHVALKPSRTPASS